jgi:lipopolysaccharide/colanic/teichoic acid biosynthesis glycosyltransferase
MPDALQRALAVVGAVVTFPLVVALALAVRLDSRGPAIYRAVRIGEGGRAFTCYKLRTMAWAPDPAGSMNEVPEITVAEDRRITRFGRFLRRNRLDELPQLWNVARGEMRLVGPRPESPRFVDLSDPLQALVFRAKPGITGLTQLAFSDEARLIDAHDPERSYRDDVLPRKVALDADYLRRRSMRLDLWILGQTFRAATGRGPSIAAIERRR